MKEKWRNEEGESVENNGERKTGAEVWKVTGNKKWGRGKSKGK